MHDMGEWMSVWWLVLLTGWTVPFVFLYLALRKPDAPAQPLARELLDQAYARGEVDRDEYLRKRDDLAQAEPRQSAPTRS